MKMIGIFIFALVLHKIGYSTHKLTLLGELLVALAAHRGKLLENIIHLTDTIEHSFNTLPSIRSKFFGSCTADWKTVYLKPGSTTGTGHPVSSLSSRNL